ncbi:Retroviral nucleocapsid protein Gag containing protein [Cricetulus griseus]|nr:Retroviral nucleocapsid protein Gag containing protein [Cricetulus griseus]
MSEALEARLSEDRDELKNICSQLETQIGNVIQKLDTKVQDTQDRVEELDNAIQSIIEASKVADHKFESRFECLEDNLQYRANRLHRSIQSIAEDSKSANRDLKSRLQYLEGSFHAIQMLPKDDRIKDLEKHVNDQLEQFTDSLTCLESFMIKEIETFPKDIITRLKDHWDASEAESLQSQAPTPPRYRDYSSKVVTRTPLVYPATMVEKPASKKHPHGQMAYEWELIQLKDLKNIKESVVSYGLHGPYVKQLLHSWATFNRVTPTDWERLVAAVLENACQIQWKSLVREEAKLFERQSIKKGFKAPLDKLLGQGIYADPQVQAKYDDDILSQCRKAALNAWDKVREPGERLEAYTRIEQGPTEQFQDFLQKLTSAIELQLSYHPKTSSTILNKCGENGHPFLIPDFSGNASNFSPFKVTINVMLRKESHNLFPIQTLGSIVNSRGRDHFQEQQLLFQMDKCPHQSSSGVSFPSPEPIFQLEPKHQQNRKFSGSDPEFLSESPRTCGSSPQLGSPPAPSTRRRGGARGTRKGGGSPKWTLTVADGESQSIAIRVYHHGHQLLPACTFESGFTNFRKEVPFPRGTVHFNSQGECLDVQSFLLRTMWTAHGGLFSADLPVPATGVFGSTPETLVLPAALHLNLGPLGPMLW